MNNLTMQPIAWAHHSTFNNLNNFDKSRFTATLSKKETNACCIPLFTNTQRTWVGLNEEDYIKAYELCDFDKDAAFEFFKAKLKEKNT
jgi:hypothetical protein